MNETYDEIIYIHFIFDDPDSDTKIIGKLIGESESILSVNFPIRYKNNWDDVSAINDCFRNWHDGDIVNNVNYNKGIIRDWGVINNPYIVKGYREDVQYFIKEGVEYSKELNKPKTTKRKPKTNVLKFSNSEKGETK